MYQLQKYHCLKIGIILVILSWTIQNCNSSVHSENLDGKKIYMDKCQPCHLSTASGLNGAVSLLEMNKLDSASLVHYVSGTLKSTYHANMKIALTEKEIEALVHYIKQRFEKEF